MNNEILELKGSKLLLCEGREEKALVAQMISENCVQPVNLLALGDHTGLSGISALAPNLEAIPALTGFDGIDAIGFFLDNDTNPPAAFSCVRDALQNINESGNSDFRKTLSVPKAAYQKCDSAEIAVATYFSPAPNQHGCLENLLLDVLLDLYGDKLSCVDQLVNCSGILAENPAWAVQKVAKAKVRAALSIIYRKNPAVALAMLWRNDASILPVSHARLKPVRDFVNSL